MMRIKTTDYLNYRAYKRLSLLYANGAMLRKLSMASLLVVLNHSRSEIPGLIAILREAATNHG